MGTPFDGQHEGLLIHYLFMFLLLSDYCFPRKTSCHQSQVNMAFTKYAPS